MIPASFHAVFFTAFFMLSYSSLFFSSMFFSVVFCPIFHLFPVVIFFFFNDTATTEIYTLSLHDALPISGAAWAINCAGPGHIASACRAAGIPLLHISTDYVYSGDKIGPWHEDDPVSPLGVYGASKEAGDRAVRDALAEHVILRTAWVYSAHGHNFVKTMLRLADTHPSLRVVADQYGCPTAAADI